MSAKRSIHMSVGFALSLMLGTSAVEAARIKCWTNKDGVRECGHAVPPEYAQQGHKVVSDTGLTVGSTSAARDSAEVKAEAEAKARADAAAYAEKRRYRIQAAKDRVLLDTFVTEAELTNQHKRNVVAIDSRIVHSREHIKKLEETLAAMQTEAANQERAGKKVPEKLLDDIADVQRQIEETEVFIKTRNEEKAALDAQHQADRDRFRHLKAGGAIGSAMRS